MYTTRFRSNHRTITIVLLVLTLVFAAISLVIALNLSNKKDVTPGGSKAVTCPAGQYEDSTSCNVAFCEVVGRAYTGDCSEHGGKAGGKTTCSTKEVQSNCPTGQAKYERNRCTNCDTQEGCETQLDAACHTTGSSIPQCETDLYCNIIPSPIGAITCNSSGKIRSDCCAKGEIIDRGKCVKASLPSACNGDTTRQFASASGSTLTFTNCQSQLFVAPYTIYSYKCNSKDLSTCLDNQKIKQDTYPVGNHSENFLVASCDPGTCGTCQQVIETTINGRKTTVSAVKSAVQSCTTSGSENNPPAATTTTTPAAQCTSLAFTDGTKTKTLSSGNYVELVMTVSNANTNTGTVVPYNSQNINVQTNTPAPAGIPITNPSGYNTMKQEPQSGSYKVVSFTTTGDNGSPTRTYRWKIAYSQIFQTDQNTSQPLSQVQFNGYAGTSSNTNCVVFLNKASTTTSTTPTSTATATSTPTVTTTSTATASPIATTTSTSSPTPSNTETLPDTGARESVILLIFGAMISVIGSILYIRIRQRSLEKKAIQRVEEGL